MTTEDTVITAEDLIGRYRKTLDSQQIVMGLPDSVEVDLATGIAKVLTEEIEKNRDDPRAAWLEVASALMLMQVHSINLTGHVANALEREQLAMTYGLQALKREGFMVGGWVLFICGAVAHFAGWL